MERQVRNCGDWAGLHLTTSGQLRRYMNKVLKLMANDEVEHCWAARQAADSSGGVPAATGEVPRSQAGGNEAADSPSGAAHGAGGSKAMAGGASGTEVGSVGRAAGRSDAAAGSAGRAAAQGSGIYDADLLAQCAAVLHGRGEEVPANDARIVERYRRGRLGGFTAAASRRKGMKTRQRCAMHDKANIGTNNEPSILFLKDRHTCPYTKDGHAHQCPLCQKEWNRQNEYKQSTRNRGGSTGSPRYSAWLLVHAL